MAAELWLPPGAPPRQQARPPAGDVRLADGRQLRRLAEYQGRVAPQAGAAWRSPDGLLVLASLDDTPHGLLLHVSLSYKSRDPSWADIRAVREAFYPATVDVMMVLPQAQDYINVHPHCFHLWETPTVWGLQ